MIRRNFLLLGLLLVSCAPTRERGSASLGINSGTSSTRAASSDTRSLRLTSAHRGCRSPGPDDSIPSIRCAVQSRADYIEIDVRKNRDGYLFLYHDGKIHVNHVAPGTGHSEEIPETLSKSELSRICDIDHPSVCIPSFEAALREVKDSSTTLQLDLKNESRGLVDSVMQTAFALHQEKDILVQCQSEDTLGYLRTRYPSVAVLARAHSIDSISKLLAYKPQLLQIEVDWLTPEVVSKAHAAGAKILVKALDALDNQDSWRSLYARGADVLMTDRIQELSNFRQ